MKTADIAIIGGGIVGLGTAYQAQKLYPGRGVIVLEKERSHALHQTGHNSGVIHSGIYYRPGSLRAQTCREGKRLLEAFCQTEEIPFELCGKVIVATREDEFPQLDRLFDRGQANGVRCEMIGTERLAELEPHTTGLRAIHVPEAGIVDYRQVCDKLVERVRARGGELLTGSSVTGIVRHPEHVTVESTSGDVEARVLVNCGGLQSDRLAWMSGVRPNAQIIPFRGEYFELKPDAQRLCRGLIYPVPDPAFPFLGVHFTRMIYGGVECGPNAVFALAREGYYKSSFHLVDAIESLTYGGFLRLALKHWRAGAGEIYRSFSKRAFLASLQRLVPSVKLDDLVPAPAGVRAQAVTRQGELVDDFLIVENERVVNVCNAPSPAATASLEIGRQIATRLESRLD